MDSFWLMKCIVYVNFLLEKLYYSLEVSGTIFLAALSIFFGLKLRKSLKRKISSMKTSYIDKVE